MQRLNPWPLIAANNTISADCFGFVNRSAIRLPK
jgi:hypothetical protein